MKAVNQSSERSCRLWVVGFFLFFKAEIFAYEPGPPVRTEKRREI